uniref:AB hydrolase-1 domain-containing protein n=1 Tax=Acrobeloides nanus TaxID=290746 RepID=A0A914E768_9BILA
MLCLHGFPEFWYTWRYQLRYFNKSYRVIAVDMRGYGDSSKPKGYQNYKLDIVVDDIIATIGALGHKSAIIMAHDWGGVVAWRLAVRRPDLVGKLIQINSPHSKVYNELLKNPVQRKRSWYLFMFQCPFLPEIYIKAGDYKWPKNVFRSSETGIKNKENFTEEDMKAWMYTYSRPGSLTPPINYYRAAMRQFRPTPFPNELIQPKTLLIWSEEDAFLVNEAADLTVPLCQEIVLKKLKNASHWAHQDCPELVNQYIEEFLKQS